MLCCFGIFSKIMQAEQFLSLKAESLVVKICWPRLLSLQFSVGSFTIVARFLVAYLAKLFGNVLAAHSL